MTRFVLDASVVLAVLQQEPGAEAIRAEMLQAAVVSAVNVAEVQGRLVGNGMPPDDAWAAALGVVSEIADFGPDQAKLAGSLVLQTKSAGLSLGDRACLALGISLQATVYTADRSWKNLKVGIPVRLIR